MYQGRCKLFRDYLHLNKYHFWCKEPYHKLLNRILNTLTVTAIIYEIE